MTGTEIAILAGLFGITWGLFAIAKAILELCRVLINISITVFNHRDREGDAQ